MAQLLGDEPCMSQTLRLGFGVFCLFPNLVVPTFSQTVVISSNVIESFFFLDHSCEDRPLKLRYFHIWAMKKKI